MHCPTNEDRELFAKTVANRLGVSARCVRKARQGSIAAQSKIEEKTGRLKWNNSAVNIGKSLTMRDMENKPFKQEERSPKKGYKVGIKRPNKGNVALIS